MSANVHTTEAIAAVKASILTFGERIDHAVSMLDTEVRRMLDWLEDDCPRYWRRRIHLAHEEVARAQAELHRCLMFPIADERPSCLEERAALKRAQEQLAYCERKLQLVGEWTRKLRQEQFEYDGRMNKLARIAELEIPRAANLLARLIGRLEEYQAIHTNQPVEAYDGVRLAEELFREDDEHVAADENSESESNEKHQIRNSKSETNSNSRNSNNAKRVE